MDGDANEEALKYFLSLLAFQPPGAKDYGLAEVIGAISKDRVAMANSWAALCPDTDNPEKSIVAGKLGYAVVPGHKGTDGQFRRMSNIGGQSMMVNKRTSNQKEVRAFVKWWLRMDIQNRFTQLGGQPSLKIVVESEAFKKMRPWHRAFSDSLPYQRDFWKTPQYYELLRTQQIELHKVIRGELTPREGLANTAKIHDGILQKK